MAAEQIDITDIRWRWGQALAQLPADAAGGDLDTFMRETVGQLLDLADERNLLAAKIEDLKALLGG